MDVDVFLHLLLESETQFKNKNSNIEHDLENVKLFIDYFFLPKSHNQIMKNSILQPRAESA